MKIGKIILVSVFLFLVFGAGYFGYLSALVDVDAFFRVEKASASKEAELLEQQARRLESIISARKRALIARKNDIVQSGRERQYQALVEESVSRKFQEQVRVLPVNNQPFPDPVEFVVKRDDSHERVDVVSTPVANFIPVSSSLSRAEKQLVALEDEFSVVKSRQKRLEVETQVKQKDVPVSPFLNRLGRVIDKQIELSQQVIEPEDPFSKVDFALLSGVDIVVQDKTSSGKVLTENHKKQIALALSVMPQDFHSKLAKLYMVYGGLDRRGLSGYTRDGVVVFIQAEQENITNVLFHEYGHVIGLYRQDDGGPRSVFSDGSYKYAESDPMVRFYDVSWIDDFSKKIQDGFVSDYGKSSIHEDFAESLIYYITHGKTFQNQAQLDSSLASKYRFLKDEFDSLEFITGPQRLFSIPYDVTLLSTDLNKVLASLGVL